jgi:hypothetical protein
MVAAKAAALTLFLALFLLATNIFGMLLLPAVSKGAFFRHVYAHGVSVLLAGMFAALFFLALGGVLLCVLNAARFRVVSPIVQMVSVMVLVGLMLLFPLFGNSMERLLLEPLGRARWIPPLWFLGVYEQLLRGDAAPAFAREMTRYAVRGTGAVAAMVLLTYPMAWARMQKMAMEGGSYRGRQLPQWMTQIVHRVVRRPGERAVFHFIGQTIRRNNRYQVYLAMYCGTGLALAVACALTFRVKGGDIQLALSDEGGHAMIPLLLFWMIAGLRTAFAFPLSLSAGWIFRVTGVNVSECTAAARKWVLLCAWSVMCALLFLLRMMGWNGRHLLVQTVFGLCLSILLTDGLFFFGQGVPFNRPRLPGKTSLPLMLTLYVGVFPPLILQIIDLEMRMEKTLSELLVVGFATVVIHVALRSMRRGSEEVEEEMEGYEGEFQVLGLS